jgi:microcin C transport system substrate-binding protein
MLLLAIIAALAVKGGSITMYGGTAPKSINAYLDNSHYTSVIFSLAYPTLLGTNEETGELEGNVAESWEVSPDGREFTFKINRNARWSDSTPITADDVKWTFDTVMSPLNDTGPWKSVLSFFDSPVVIDERTVRFSKKSDSSPDWRDILNCSSFWILPKHKLKDKVFSKIDFVGEVTSGAYYFEKVEDEVKSVLKRDASWWRVEDEKQNYNFDRIIVRYFASGENAYAAFKRGKIDFYPVYSARLMAQETSSEEFTRNFILKRRVVNNTPVGFQGFAMNMRREPFNDLRVRKAMAYLVDRERMNRVLMHGEYFLLKSYYHDLYDESHPCRNAFYEFNPKKAGELLDEAGWKMDPVAKRRMKKGKKLSFTYLSRSADEDRYLTLFSQALKECGIEMKIERKDFASWMRDMDEFNFDMTIAAWGSGLVKYPAIQWSSAEASRKGSNNITGFKNAKVDELIEKERQMRTKEERNDAYRQIDKLIADEVPYVLLWSIAEVRLLYWNKFGMPKTILPRYGREEGALVKWWYDEDRAAELEKERASKGFLPNVPTRVYYAAEGGK